MHAHKFSSFTACQVIGRIYAKRNYVQVGKMVCSLMLHKKQCKSGRSSFWENGKAGIYIKSKGSKRQNIITHEPWAWHKSVVDRAHELKLDRRRNLATLTSLAFYNSHSFLRPLTNEHNPSFPSDSSSF